MSAAETRDSQGSGRNSPSPQTPETERSKNEVRCLVKLLDGEVLQFGVERKAKAEELIEMVMSRLNVVERDYFGVYYAVREQRFFLNPLKACARQYPDRKESQWVLHFGVKYYVPDPHQLKDDFTKHLYCLQLLQDIKEGRVLLDPTSGPALQLAALTVQASLGEYDPEHHGQGYTHKHLDFLYGNENDIPPDVEDKVREIHQEKRELNPAECDTEFLIIAKDLPHYGKHFFQATELLDDERAVEISVGYMGIFIYYDKKLATDHPWSVVNKLLYHGRRFKIYYHPEDDQEHWEIKKHKFDATETKWSKRIWKECVEQHTFFRLMVPGVPRLPTLIPRFSRNSTIRFSGRTLAQIQQHAKRGDSDGEQQEGPRKGRKRIKADAANSPGPAEDAPPQSTDSRHEEDSPKISGNVSDTSNQEDNLFVELKREPSGFGFSIRGGAEYGARMCVLNIAPEGAAEKDGKLRESDEILEINGRSTECMLHSVAICIIKHGDDNLKLVVRRAVKDGYEEEHLAAKTEDNTSGVKMIAVKGTN